MRQLILLGILTTSTMAFAADKPVPLPEKVEPRLLVRGISFAEGPAFDSKGALFFVNYKGNCNIGRRTPAGEVEVSGTAHSLRQEVMAGVHHLVADEPAADGGADAGPTPYAMLLAALGACTGMTMRLYADRKGFPLAGTRVRLRHSRDHKADCETCAENGARLERIDRELELLGLASQSPGKRYERV